MWSVLWKEHTFFQWMSAAGNSCGLYKQTDSLRSETDAECSRRTLIILKIPNAATKAAESQFLRNTVAGILVLWGWLHFEYVVLLAAMTDFFHLNYPKDKAIDNAVFSLRGIVINSEYIKAGREKHRNRIIWWNRRLRCIELFLEKCGLNPPYRQFMLSMKISRVIQ